MEKRALVTGANRGIGREVARLLAANDYAVVLTARRMADAREAAAELGVDAAQLDVTRDDSVAALREQLNGKALHVLVNNAGIALDGFDARVAERTIATNFFGVRRVTETFLPLLGESARIVMVSSGMGELAGVQDPIRAQLQSSTLNEAELVRLMEEFPDHVRRGTFEQLGWPRSAYRVSKVGLNGYTRLLAARLGQDPRRILVNAVCPGWVRTDMGGRHAPRSVEQGARSVTWAAMIADDGPTGGFFRDGKPIDW